MVASAIAGLCPLTTTEALQRAAELGGDVEAYVTPEERVTYAELLERVERTRAALASRGVRHGDHVAICLGNGPLWVELFFAISSLGAVVVPINTRFTARELEYCLRQSRSRFLITADIFLRNDYIAMLRSIDPAVDGPPTDGPPMPALPDLTELLVIGPGAPARALAWDTVTNTPTQAVRAAAAPDDVALIQYTSGSTAFPKGVLLTHAGMCANGFVSGQRQGLRAGDRMLSVRPLFHVSGTTLSLIACVQHVTTLVSLARFEAGPALALMEAERCTHFSGNDTISLMLLDHPDRPTRQLPLRGAWLAASPPVIRRVVDELGATECVSGYGLSEASPNIAMTHWKDPLEIRLESLMAPQPGVEIRIADPETGAPRAPGVTGGEGEIQARGWNVMRGYFDLPEQTTAAFTDDGWLRTGDLGVLDEHGRLRFIGRAKDLIRVGGENVSPAEVEDTLALHPRIERAIVVGVPDDRLVEVPFAFVQPGTAGPLDPTEVMAWAKGRLAGFKVPRHVEVMADVTTLGLTASSKVRRSDAAAAALTILERERMNVR